MVSSTLQSSPLMMTMTTESDDAEDTAVEDTLCRHQWRLIINTVIAGALCVFGLVGNGVSYRVLGRDTEILPVPRLLVQFFSSIGEYCRLLSIANCHRVLSSC